MVFAFGMAAEVELVELVFALEIEAEAEFELAELVFVLGIVAEVEIELVELVFALGIEAEVVEKQALEFVESVFELV